jgi:hypothetical protein
VATLQFESPLHWPASIPATPRANQRSDHGFPAQTLSESIGYLEQELKELHASGALSLDVEQPLVERLRKKVGSRTGIALTIKYHGRTYHLTCDRWLTVEANIYALHLALRQWRNMERWGIATIPQLLAGFVPSVAAHASAPANSGVIWMEALGLGTTATLDDAVAVYHRRAKQVSHDQEAMTRLNQMMEEARAYFSSQNG